MIVYTIGVVSIRTLQAADFQKAMVLMMVQKRFNGERKIMELIRAREPINAKEGSLLAAKECSRNRNTTVLKKLAAKGQIPLCAHDTEKEMLIE